LFGPGGMDNGFHVAATSGNEDHDVFHKPALYPVQEAEPRKGERFVAVQQMPRRLFEGVKHAERNLFFGPVIGRVAEHVEQGFARFLVELLGIRQLLDHDNKTGLRAGLVDGVGQRFAQGIEIFAAGLGKMEALADPAAHLLLGERIGTVGVQKMLTQAHRFLLQFHDSERTDGLHQIGRHCYQQTHFSPQSNCVSGVLSAISLLFLRGCHAPI
jgi:hypothetical protein